MNVHADKIVANEFIGENINKANIDLDNLSENGTNFLKSFISSIEGELKDNGYVKFSNGLIFQWVYCTESNGTNDYKNFPIPFPNKFLAGWASQDCEQKTHMWFAWFNNEQRSCINFRCGLNDDYDDAGKNIKLMVFAIGY